MPLRASSQVIPWRDSKLTMLLRDKIGGQNLTLMIGALSPARAEPSTDGSPREAALRTGAFRGAGRSST